MRFLLGVIVGPVVRHSILNCIIYFAIVTIISIDLCIALTPEAEMKVVALCGSPRDYGNCAAVIKHFLKSAQRKIQQYWSVQLNDLRYRGCQGCYACKKDYERCVMNDALTPILAAVEVCDVLFIASPIYFGDLPGQLKMFVDRTFSFLTPDFAQGQKTSRLQPGKTLVMALLQGHPNLSSHANVFTRYSAFFKQQGFTSSILARGHGIEKLNSLDKHPELLRHIDEIASSL